MQKFLLYFLLALSLLGVIDAGYLIVESAGGKPVICPSVPVGRFNLDQCNIVLTTPYAKFLGMPTALYGLVFYLFSAVLVLYVLSSQWLGALKILLSMSGLAFLVSLYFVYLQFFIIKALCFYCLISAAITTLIFTVLIAYNSRYSEKILGV